MTSIENFDEDLYDTFGKEFRAICSKYKRRVDNIVSKAAAGGPSKSVKAKKAAAPTSRAPVKLSGRTAPLNKNASHISIGSSTISNKGSTSTSTSSSRSNSTTQAQGKTGGKSAAVDPRAAAAKFGLDLNDFRFEGNKRGGGKKSRAGSSGRTIGSAPGSRGGIQAMPI